jgi:hypothetical protein
MKLPCTQRNQHAYIQILLLFSQQSILAIFVFPSQNNNITTTTIQTFYSILSYKKYNITIHNIVQCVFGVL